MTDTSNATLPLADSSSPPIYSNLTSPPLSHSNVGSGTYHNAYNATVIADAINNSTARLPYYMRDTGSLANSAAAFGIIFAVIVAAAIVVVGIRKYKLRRELLNPSEPVPVPQPFRPRTEPPKPPALLSVSDRFVVVEQPDSDEYMLGAKLETVKVES